MKQVSMFLVAAVLIVTFAGVLAAQSKSFTRETQKVTATVEAIAADTRTLTLKDPDGEYYDFTVSDEVKRFSEIKVGDTITVRYYSTVVVRLKAPGEKAIDSATEAATPGSGVRPAGTLAKQRPITATSEAIDPKVPSIKFKGPNGWNYSSRIQDRKVLKTIKVGDRVDITWTEAALLSIESIRKK